MDPIINHRKIKGMIKLVKKAAMAFAAGNVLVLTGLVSGIVSQAGQWEQDHLGIWSYRYSDGDLLKDGWYWIDGDMDGTAECYCFDSQGNMYQNTTTPDGYQVDPWGAWMTEEGTQTKTMDRELTGIPLGMALLSDSTLVNKWSDYRLLIPPDSDISIVSEYRDEEARGQNYYDIGTAATAEYGGYSLFIWYHKDNDPQIPAGDQMRKHNYDLIHEYRYPGPFVETERVIGGHGFSGFKYKAWGYGHQNFTRKIDDMVMEMAFSYPDNPECEEMTERFIDSIQGGRN